jgi:5-methylcytosine-specific restriction endonuclease McrA
VYCGEQFAQDELTLDHVQPRVHGGDRSEGNLVTACMGCNTLKGHQRLSQFLHEHPAARRNFFELAVHVWPRLLRILERELADIDAPVDSMKKA